MAKINMTDTGLRSLAAPERGQKSYWDANLPSFGLRISQGGSKTFVLNRDNSLLTIGRFGVISLSEARTEAKRLLAERTLGKVRPRSMSFQTASDEFLAEKEKSRRKSTVDNHRDRMSRHFSFKCQLAEVTNSEVVRRLAKIRTNAEYDHALSVARTFFTWCMNRRYIDDNPTRGIEMRGSLSRSRVLSDNELVKIWRACSEATEQFTRGAQVPEPEGLSCVSASLGPETYAIGQVPPRLPANYATIVKLLMLTGQRRGEIAALRTSFVEAAIVTLPVSLTKNGYEHFFPLSNLAAEVLQSVEVDTTKNDAFFFPARGKPDKCFNGWSKAIKALRQILGEDFPHFTIHDLRRTYRTNLGRLKIPPHIGERLLNHVSARSEVEMIYDRYLYLDEMCEAVTRYNDWFTDLLKQNENMAQDVQPCAS